MARFVQFENRLYDLSDSSLETAAIGTYNGKDIYSAESLLCDIEEITQPVVIFPIEHDSHIIENARWFN